jgi:hypothetical protein
MYARYASKKLHLKKMFSTQQQNKVACLESYICTENIKIHFFLKFPGNKLSNILFNTENAKQEKAGFRIKKINPDFR